jgi:uncharacterized membrane protein
MNIESMRTQLTSFLDFSLCIRQLNLALTDIDGPSPKIANESRYSTKYHVFLEISVRVVTNF